MSTIPFPIVRRHAFIARQVELIAAMSARGAKRYIANQCDAQAKAMRRKQVDEATIAREVAALEAALRAGLAPMSSGAA